MIVEAKSVRIVEKLSFLFADGEMKALENALAVIEQAKDDVFSLVRTTADREELEELYKNLVTTIDTINTLLEEETDIDK